MMPPEQRPGSSRRPLRPARRPRLQERGVRSIALSVLAILGILYTLYFAKAVILPVVLALILSLLLGPAVQFFQQKLRVPAALGSGIVLAALLGSLIAAASFVVEPAANWIQAAPARMPEIKERLNLLKTPFEKISEASQQVEELADVGTGGDEPVVKMRGSTPAGLLMTETPAFVANILVMFILLYFMLASGDLFLRKLVHIVPTFEDKRRAVAIAREIQDRISRYLRTVTVINLGLGTAVGLAAYFVGLNNYVLWGVLAFILNYVPYLGAFVGIVTTFLAGLLAFESVLHAFLMPALYLLLNAIEGNLVTPIVMGRILTLNPVIVFVSLMFWGWIWGIPGALLAVPILAIFKIVCDHLKPLAPIGEFVGGGQEGAGISASR